METEAEKDAQRTARRQNRGKWHANEVSPEFIKGALGATALNITSGLAHALWNVGAKGVSKANENRQKADILNAEETRSILTRALYYSILNMHYTIIEYIHLYYPDKNLGFSEQSRQNAASLLNNIEKGYIPAKKVRQALTECVLSNPYNQEVYRQWVRYYPNECIEVGQFAAYFHIEVHPELRETFEEKAKTLDFSGKEQAEASLSILKAEALRLHYADWAIFSENKRNEALAYEREIRIVNGKLYSTRELADAARKDLKKRTVKGVIYPTIAAAEHIRSQRHVGKILGFFMFWIPFLALITLRKGYSKLARGLSLTWLFLYLCFMFFPFGLLKPEKSVMENQPQLTAEAQSAASPTPESPPTSEGTQTVSPPTDNVKTIQLPFFGTRYFNFYNDDDKKIMFTIENDGTTIVKSVQDDTIFYQDRYQEHIPVGGNKTLRIHDNEISLFEADEVMNGCLDENLECTVILTTE